MASRSDAMALPSAVPPLAAAAGRLPVLDFGAYLDEQISEEERARLLPPLAEKLRAACKDTGFYFLAGAEQIVPEALVKEVFAATAKFHDLPMPAKASLGLEGKVQRGYFSTDLDVMNSDDPNASKTLNTRSAYNATYTLTRGFRLPLETAPYPDKEVPEFRPLLAQYDAAMDRLTTLLLPVYELALGMPPGSLTTPMQTNPMFLYHLKHYPETPKRKDGEEEVFGIAPHADGDFFTILAQNEVPGLSLWLPKTKEWLPVPALPRTFLVNSGEVLHRLSNGKWPNTVHKADNRSGVERYAVVSFVSFSGAVSWDTVLDPGEQPRWGRTTKVRDVNEDIRKNGFDATLHDESAQLAAKL